MWWRRWRCAGCKVEASSFETLRLNPTSVIRGLDPRIHLTTQAARCDWPGRFFEARWIAGSSPATTLGMGAEIDSHALRIRRSSLRRAARRVAAEMLDVAGADRRYRQDDQHVGGAELMID